MVKKMSIEEKLFLYLKSNNKNITYERKHLIVVVNDIYKSNDNKFSSLEFVNKAMKKNISYGTCYNFITLLMKADIIKVEPKTYSFVK